MSANALARSIVFTCPTVDVDGIEAFYIGCVDHRIKRASKQLVKEHYGYSKEACMHYPLAGGVATIQSNENVIVDTLIKVAHTFIGPKPTNRHDEAGENPRVIICNHSDCLVYKEKGLKFASPEAEREFHIKELSEAEGWLYEQFPWLGRVDKYYFEILPSKAVRVELILTDQSF